MIWQIRVWCLAGGRTLRCRRSAPHPKAGHGSWSPQVLLTECGWWRLILEGQCVSSTDWTRNSTQDRQEFPQAGWERAPSPDLDTSASHILSWEGHHTAPCTQCHPWGEGPPCQAQSSCLCPPQSPHGAGKVWVIPRSPLSWGLDEGHHSALGCWSWENEMWWLPLLPPKLRVDVG